MSEPAVDLFGHGVALIGHLAWPSVVVVLLILIRTEARSMAAAIADRIGNPDTDVTIGRGGLEITRNRHQETATETKLENAIKSNPDIEESVEAWLREQGVAVSLTSFLYGDAYTDMRDQCVTEFNLQ